MNDMSMEDYINDLIEGAALDDEWYVIINPDIWNGYWYVERTIPALRWLGRKLHNKYIYWLGFQVHWEKGLKEYLND